MFSIAHIQRVKLIEISFTGKQLAVEDHVCAYGCQKKENIPYFLFPTGDNELSEKWIEFVKRGANKDIEVHQYLQLCGNHFSSSDFIEVKCYP